MVNKPLPIRNSPQNTMVQQASEDTRKAQEKLEINEKYFSLLVNRLKDYAILMISPKGEIISWNQGAARLTGYTSEEILGQHFSILFIPEDRKKGLPEKELQQAKRKGQEDDNNFLFKKNGSKIWVNGVTTALYDAKNNLLCFGKVVHDMTQQRELEARKDEFIGMASHELRTPVTGIKTYIQALTSIAKKNGDTFYLRYLDKVDSQVLKLTHLIQDLLDLSRINEGKLSMREELFDFNAEVKDIVEVMKQTTDNHTIKVKGKAPKKIKGDREHIGEVLINLLSNAIRYSPEGGDIVVTIQSARTNKSLKVSVQDWGIGIAEANQKRIFERFTQVDGNSKEKTYPGLGMGLYIAGKIIAMHKGALEVKSEKGKGSTFSFTLPYR